MPLVYIICATTEAVNNDDSVIVAIQEEFSKLGYHFNSNSDAKAKNLAKQKAEKGEKRFEYIQKYSNDSLLAEAVIVDGKPCFAIVSTEDGRITLQEEIPLNDSKNTVLKAPDLSSYINISYSFDSVLLFNRKLKYLDMHDWLIHVILSANLSYSIENN